MRWIIPLLFLHPCLSGQIPAVNADQMASWRTSGADSILIVNFWATWCVPCIEELPDILQLREAYADKGVHLVLVSNDFKRHIASRLEPFAEARQLKSFVVFMDEPNPNTWIDSVSPQWSGAIPATWIIWPKRQKEAFFEGKMTYPQMEDLLLSVLNN
jgi:thiol-disulfide isomerase/thioredoxin